MRTLWILGQGGLLGSALCRRYAAEQETVRFIPAAPIPWNDGSAALSALEENVRLFGDAVVQNGGTWEIVWAAGQGTMGKTTEEMKAETDLLSGLLRRVGENAILGSKPGTVVLSSSAGSIYAGTNDAIVTESSRPHPLSPYGEAKLLQEQILREWALSKTQISVFIARISTLYGPDQSQAKHQGLLSHIARSIVRKTPVNIFVPLDTIRDYLYADDAANIMHQTIRRIRGTGTVEMKIVASEQAVSIGQIVGVFRLLTRLSPRIITSSGAQSRLYKRRLLLRSVHLPCSCPRTGLTIGIASIPERERRNMASKS